MIIVIDFITNMNRCGPIKGGQRTMPCFTTPRLYIYRHERQHGLLMPHLARTTLHIRNLIFFDGRFCLMFVVALFLLRPGYTFAVMISTANY